MRLFAPLTAALVLSACTLGTDGTGRPTAAGGAGGHGGASSSAAGATGSGGSAGGNNPCVPESTQPCYSGAPETEGIGACKAGTRTCERDGSGFGACIGEVLPTAEVCSSATIDESCDGQQPCTGTVMLGRVFPDALELPTVRIAHQPSGDVSLVVDTSGQIDFGGGAKGGSSLDILVARFDSAGTHVASAAFGDAYLNIAFGAAPTPDDGIVLAGAFEGTIDLGSGMTVTEAGPHGDFVHDVFVAKLDAGLTVEWVRRFGDAYDQDAYAVDVGPSGDVFVAGDFESTLDFGAGPMTSGGADDVFVAKLDSSGTTVWSKRFGDYDAEQAWGVAAAKTGRVWVCGDFETQLEIVAGSPLGASAVDGFVAQLDVDGTPISSAAVSTSGYDTLSACAATPDGGVVAVGAIGGLLGPAPWGGGEDVVVVAHDALGNQQWVRAWGDAANQRARSVAVDAAGHVVVVGSFSGVMTVGSFTLTAADGADAFAVKLAPDGTPVWADRFGGGGGMDQAAAWVDVRPDGSALVAGWLDGALDVRGGPLTAVGAFDPFFLVLSP